MNFFTILRNFIRCLFCKKIWRTNCMSRFRVGKEYHNITPIPMKRRCPKKHVAFVYRNITVKEVREKMLKDADKE